ncbi:MAG: aspartate kinase [Alphaproteobacteria bacterium]|nr:aspartate kinase [Alphaproteobacteria bacterium]MDP6590881.1 aspartate kinase [Alphaproteobacteria bacterium]MDP6818698.1 aspartate kinase [Alphaproteobacteria bacterium]
MAVIVQKFGGTSVSHLGPIRRVARRVKAELDAGNEVAVVVSAMAGVTDQLVGWVRDMAPGGSAAEHDVVVSSGEQVTSGLVALALQQMGVEARSWMGWQLPVRTSASHMRARIHEIDTGEIKQSMAAGGVPVVAGFQGLSPDGRVTTVGRGGSDTLAVALAAALGAERCDLYSDVTGVFTADPWIVNNARKLDKITCEEMLELASLGAKVLDPRAVRLALRHRVPIQVLSSFADLPGTLVEGTIITDVWGMQLEDDEKQNVVTGIAYSRDDAKITVVRVPDKPGVAADILAPLSVAEIKIDMIVQNVSHNGQATDITFTIAREDAGRALEALRKLQGKLEFEEVLSDSEVAKVSVIGVGMQSHAGVAQTMFSALAENDINIQVISTSEIKISVLIDERHTELAVRALHAAYRLDE